MDWLVDLLLPDSTLTLTERNVLSYMLAQPNILISHEQLLREVWEYNTPIKTRTVSTTIERIRRKIQHSGLEIQTVWGQGLILDTTALSVEDVIPIVRHCIGDDEETWCSHYHLSEAHLLSHTEHATELYRLSCSVGVWQDAFTHVLGRARLTASGALYLRKLCQQNTLTTHDVFILEQVTQHVPLDIHHLDKLEHWSMSSLTPTQAYDILKAARTTTASVDVLRMGLMGFFAALTQRVNLSNTLFKKAHQAKESDSEIMSRVYFVEAISLSLTGSYSASMRCAERSVELAQSPIQRATGNAFLGKMYADCRKTEAETTLLDAIETLSHIDETDTSKLLRHSAQIALAQWYVQCDQKTQAQALLVVIDEHDLHPNNHISYAITNALLALRQHDPTGERWLRYRMPGISSGAQEMIDFLHALFQSLKPHFQPEVMHVHLQTPSGPRAHLRALTAACVLNTKPLWPLRPNARQHFLHITDAHHNQHLTPIECYFAFGELSLEEYVI